ncbi:hypothetical protein [Conexibacter sp. CPCC 206217]|uniref:hypothetical protein n=1 Tax=Conexibacter sp. CPCC 206217 TaxID=3064574 RepID=UPI00271A14AE|nr:hypothetical protein [Conexibacter sp. CPCC 206217]MDO8211329.1 hypothetical protein [Conexibacter sp. CPCC 206217]
MSAVEPPFLAELRQEFARVAEADAQASAAKGAASRRGRLRMPRLRPMGLRTALPVLAAVAALGGGAFVVLEGISLRDEVAPVTTGPRPQGASGFNNELVRRISTLSRVRTDVDAIDPGVIRQLPAGLLPDASLLIDPAAPNAGSAATPSTTKAWLVPAGTGRLALVTQTRDLGPQIMLGDLTAITRGQVVSAVTDELVGVAPNGVTRVRVHMVDGREVELPVRGNVFAAHLPATFQSVEWDGMTRP